MSVKAGGQYTVLKRQIRCKLWTGVPIFSYLCITERNEIDELLTPNRFEISVIGGLDNLLPS